MNGNKKSFVALALAVITLMIIIVFTQTHFRPSEGKIVSKKHEKERNWYEGAGERSDNIVLITDDEDYILTIQSEQGQKSKLYVSKKEYKSLKIGEKVRAEETYHHDPLLRKDQGDKVPGPIS